MIPPNHPLYPLTERLKWVGPNRVDLTIVCNVCCAKVIDSGSTRAQHEDFHRALGILARRAYVAEVGEE